MCLADEIQDAVQVKKMLPTRIVLLRKIRTLGQEEEDRLVAVEWLLS